MVMNFLLTRSSKHILCYWFITAISDINQFNAMNESYD
jgi:hypothetical protein